MTKKASGIMSIDYYKNGDVISSFLELDNNTFGNEESHLLFASICDSDEVNLNEITLSNTAYVPCRYKQEANLKMSTDVTGLTSVMAGEEYAAGGWKRFWYGDHYRTTWTTPVQVPTLDLDNTFGGLTIFKKGGGRQTTSLKFKSGNGTLYTFRSVNKDPTKALTYKLRPTLASRVIRDQTTAQQPFGAIAVAPLLDKIDILHVTPELYLLPDDAKLGPFQGKYGGLFGMLEENPGKKNTEGELFGGADEIVKSTQLFRDFYKKQKVKVDQAEFVRARLFDILVGDWSKHEDNWKWAGYDKKDGWRIYRPIPRDRDHVFSRMDGVIPWLADRRFGVANIENFATDVKDIQSLTWQARHMDRFIATQVSKELFVKQAQYIQDNISEKDIEKAIRMMPAEIYEKSGREIEGKLKSRLKDLGNSALRYYALLAREVEVLGSVKDEYFEINYQSDGKVEVKVYKAKKNEKSKTCLLYTSPSPRDRQKSRMPSSA